MAVQNEIDAIIDEMQRGLITANEANVLIARAARVKLVTCSLPKEVRKALDEAVKNKELCHVKRDGRKPEAYYHPDFEHLANAKRNEEERRTIEALLKVCG